MKPKTMILMGLAVTCGLGASYMTSRLLAERSAPEDEKVTILVAKKNLSVGQRITKPEELFDQKEIRKEDEPPDAIKDYEALKDKLIKQPRNKGDHISAASLLDKSEGLRIPEGHKAFGMRVNLETTAAGFATLPQSRVNLIWTTRGPDLNSSEAKILLEGVLVLAADLELTREGKLASPAQVVTFALTDEEILKVSVARENGTLALALRNLDDQSNASIKEVKGSSMRHQVKKEVPSIAQAIIPETPKVEPKVEPKVIVQTPTKPIDDGPKFTKSSYDVVQGAENGVREVWRVHFNQFEDGSIQITRRELVETTRIAVQDGSKVTPRDY